MTAAIRVREASGGRAVVDEEVRRLHARGMGYKRIGHRLGLSKSAVRCVAVRIGLELRSHNDPRGDQGRKYAAQVEALLREFGSSTSDYAIAKTVGCGRTFVRTTRRLLGCGAAPKTRRPWTPEEDAVLHDLLATGCTTKEIAAGIPGRSEHSVGCRMHHLGFRTAEGVRCRSGGRLIRCLKANGWSYPLGGLESLTPRQSVVLVSLLSGPMTLSQIGDTVYGRRSSSLARSKYGLGPGNGKLSVLGALEAAGLVVRVSGLCRSSIYLLSEGGMLALETAADAARGVAP